MKLRLDQLADRSNRELCGLLNGINCPDFVKDAEVDNAEDFEFFEKDAFADDFNKAFPITSPARVYISNAFFISKKAALEKRWGAGYTAHVEDRIKTAAKLFDIEQDLQDYVKQAEALNNKDYPSEPVYVMNLGGHSFNLFPTKTAEEFTTVATTFANNISNFPFPERQKIAEAFVAKASKYGVDELPDIICKYAGMFYPDLINLSAKLWHRATKSASADVRAKYESLIAAIPAVDSKDDVFKLAHIVDHFEREAGLSPKVAQSLGDPVDQFFTWDIEKVSEMLNVVTMGGETYAVKDLVKVSSDIFKEAFGIDIDPNNQQQLKDVLPTMPLSDVSLFRELSGVSPI